MRQDERFGERTDENEDSDSFRVPSNVDRLVVREREHCCGDRLVVR
jgi:hypothetical protein